MDNLILTITLLPPSGSNHLVIARQQMLFAFFITKQLLVVETSARFLPPHKVMKNMATVLHTDC